MFKIDYVPIFEDNYIWLIINPQQKKAIAIDPGDATPLQAFLKEKDLELSAILVTHHHWDHTGGIKDLKKLYEVEVYGPKHEKIEGVTQPVDAADELHFSMLEETIRILDIPAHTLGHIAYYFSNILFCGDTLFSASCGRVFEGTVEQMIQALEKLTDLSEDTLVYCTHEYTLENLEFALKVEPHNADILKKWHEVSALRQENRPSLPSTIGDEKKINPFLRCTFPDVIRSTEQYCGHVLPTPKEVFTYLREWRSSYG